MVGPSRMCQSGPRLKRRLGFAGVNQGSQSGTLVALFGHFRRLKLELIATAHLDKHVALCDVGKVFRKDFGCVRGVAECSLSTLAAAAQLRIGIWSEAKQEEAIGERSLRRIGIFEPDDHAQPPLLMQAERVS